jgi:hypothetical protein
VNRPPSRLTTRTLTVLAVIATCIALVTAIHGR